MVQTPRPGDQQLPVHNDGPSMHDLVLEDFANGLLPPWAWVTDFGDFMRSRKALGLERYGTILQANNGRDAGREVSEELADALVYLKQMLLECGEDESEDYRQIHGLYTSTANNLAILRKVVAARARRS